MEAGISHSDGRTDGGVRDPCALPVRDQRVDVLGFQRTRAGQLKPQRPEVAAHGQ